MPYYGQKGPRSLKHSYSYASPVQQRHWAVPGYEQSAVGGDTRLSLVAGLKRTVDNAALEAAEAKKKKMHLSSILL